MRPFVLALLAALATGLGAGPAGAQAKNKLIYAEGNWQVRLGSMFGNPVCAGRLKEGGAFFLFWRVPGERMVLSFNSEDWSFGEPHKADIALAIDGEAAWKMENADLRRHTIIYQLPRSKAATELIVKIGRGSTMTLRESTGATLHRFTLDGADRAIRATARCIAAMTKPPPTDRGGASDD